MIRIYDKFETLNKISSLINPFSKKWINDDETNCYAYAIGLDSTREDVYPYTGLNPGTFSDNCLSNPFTLEDLLSNLENDLHYLGIDYKDVSSDYNLKPGEWKIAVMITSDFSYDSEMDYHFLRQTKNGIWYHKMGLFHSPTMLDSRGNPIKNPETSIIETNGLFTSTKYDYKKTLCLRKK